MGGVGGYYEGWRTGVSDLCVMAPVVVAASVERTSSLRSSNTSISSSSDVAMVGTGAAGRVLRRRCGGRPVSRGRGQSRKKYVKGILGNHESLRPRSKAGQTKGKAGFNVDSCLFGRACSSSGALWLQGLLVASADMRAFEFSIVFGFGSILDFGFENIP